MSESIISLSRDLVNKVANPQQIDGAVVWRHPRQPEKCFRLKLDGAVVRLVWGQIESDALFSVRSRTIAPIGWRGASRRGGSPFGELPQSQQRYENFAEKIKRSLRG